MFEKKRVELKAIRVAYEGLPPEIKSNGMRSSFALAGAVVRAFMGDQWFDRHVMPSQRKPGFVTMDESTQVSLDLSAYRLIDLAELLYNLQLVEGFDDCLSRMRQGGIEATYAELDLGRMLFWHCVLFRYVKPTGETGADYDVDIIYAGEQMVLLRGVAQVADNVSAESAPLEYTLIRTLGTGFEKAGQGADAASNSAISRHEVAARRKQLCTRLSAGVRSRTKNSASAKA
jgi:hypothetical protein